MTPKLPRTDSKKLLKALQQMGFFVHYQRGSHIHLRHRERSDLRVVVPAQKKSIAPKTLKTILAQAELSVEELIELL